MIKLQRAYCATFSPDGKLIATTNLSKVVLRDTSAGVKQAEWNVKHSSHLAFAPDGSSLVVKTTSGSLFALDLSESDAPPRPLCLDEGEGPAPRFTADGRFLVDGSWHGSLRLRRSADGVPVWQRDNPHELITSVHSDATGARWVAVHTPAARTSDRQPDPVYLTLWDYPFREPTRVVKSLVDSATGTALSPDGAILAVRHGYPPEQLSLFELPSGKLRKRTSVSLEGLMAAPAWSADGRVLANVGDDCVYFYDCDLVKLGKLPAVNPCALAFSPNDLQFAFGSWSTGVLLQREELPFVASAGASLG